MVKEKPKVALVDTTGDESVEAMERVGTATKAKPIELPSAGDMSAVEESRIAKPIEQPGMGNLSTTGMSITTKPAVQHGTGDTSAMEISKASEGKNQHGPVVLGCKESRAQSRESAKKQNDVDANWRRPLTEYLRAPDNTVDRRIRRQALKYTLMDGELCRRTMDGLLLKCLSKDQAKIAMGEVHEGMCGAHQSAQKLKWAIRRAGLYWPSMVDDCIRYKKGCEAC
jgi:hypothetical protein